MQFEWTHFLDIAKFLHSNGISNNIPQEGAYRSAIGRSYYAAFCHARTYAVDYLGYTPEGNEEDHKTLRVCFSDHNLRPISSELDRLRQWRNDCDYDLPCYVATDNNSRASIGKAERIVSSLKP